MANIKSAKKRILVTRKKAERNKSVKSGVKTYIKKVETAIEAGNKAEAEEALKTAIGKITSAANKGVYHKNTAARKVSRLTLAVNKLA
ncbi:MAG: 30S ribosomal protein S20 [Lachnospiraceae bacterium]|nr:30S ribosomal protein S20 [Lachnospiraceae bacterium]